MLVLIAILVLLIFLLALVLIRLRWPGFAYSWLLAAFGAMVVWPLVVLARSQLGFIFRMGTWLPEENFPSSPLLLFDSVSWTFSLVLVTMLLAGILSDAARTQKSDRLSPGWTNWAGSLLMTIVGLLGVCAGNLASVLLAWALLDGVEAALRLRNLSTLEPGNAKDSEKLVAFLVARIAGIFLAWAGAVLFQNEGLQDFNSLSPETTVFLLVACGLRMGALPPIPPLPAHLAPKNSEGGMLRFTSAAVCLSVVARSAASGIPNAGGIILPLLGLSTLYGSLSFVSAREVVEGQPHWVTGMAALALASALAGLPAASLSWSLAALLPGALLFFYSKQRTWLTGIVLLGLVGASGLPFTPTWAGFDLLEWLVEQRAALSWLAPLFLLCLAMLLAGFLRHALRVTDRQPFDERWIGLFYPLGLFMLPLAHFLGWWWNLSPRNPTWLGTASASLGLLAAAGGWLVARKLGPSSPRLISGAGRFISLAWLYRLAWRVILALRKLFSAASIVLEGPAGILWALLFLILIISLITGLGVGG